MLSENFFIILLFTGPNKKTETLLQQMKKQLTQMQDDINILRVSITAKGRKRSVVLSVFCLFVCLFVI